MQQRQFDAFSRALAHLLDRRQGVIAALALAPASLLVGDAAAKKGKKKRRKRKRKSKNKKKRKKRRGDSGPRNCDSIALVEGALLHRCDLRNHPGLAAADFTNARLEDADLSGADLSDVSFRGAWMWRANLQGANLANADFSHSSEKKTDIFEVDFTGANWDSAIGLEEALYHHYAKF